MGHHATGNRNVLLDLKPLQLGGAVSVGHVVRRSAERPLDFQAHPNTFEVMAVAHGKHVIIVNGETYTINGGEAFVTLPGEVHGTGHEPQFPGTIYWLQFEDIPAKGSFLGLPVTDGQALLRGFRSLPRIAIPGAERLFPNFENLIAACQQQNDPLRAADVRNWFLRLLIDLLRLARGQRLRAISPLMARIRSQIESRLKEPLSVAELAKENGISTNELAALFSRTFGINPRDYIERQRIEFAREMLRTTTTPVTRLALDLGFLSSQHFSTVFKRVTSRTPREYRREAKAAR